MTMMELRRRIMMVQRETWDYILFPDESGKIPKTKISLTEGQTVYMEWDTSKLGTSQTPCVFSFYTQVQKMVDVCPEFTGGGYPICWANGSIGQLMYYVGHATLVMPKDLEMFIGYWRDSDTTDRRITADWLKIRIL